MSEHKHTPGPWHRNVPPARQYPTVFAGRNMHIAALRPDSRISDEEAEANLNLIAAAPDLLAACETTLRLMRQFGHTHETCSDYDNAVVLDCLDTGMSSALSNVLGRAIAAARGEAEP